MKDTDKTKEQLVWEIKKLKQQQTKAIQAKEQELKQLSQVLETVTSTLDLDVVVERVLKALSDIFEFNQSSIYLFNSENNTLDMNHWFGEEIDRSMMKNFVDFPLSIERDDIYFIKAFLDNETQYVSPITDKLLERYSEPDRQMFAWNPHKAILIIPLQVQEKVIGVINFAHTLTPFNLNEAAIEQVERYVSQIATTINNAYLVKKTNFALARAQTKEKEIGHLNKVIQASNASLNVDDVFEAILTGLKDVFDFEAIGIQLVDTENNLLNIFKVYGEMIEDTHIAQWQKIQIAAKGADSVSSYVFDKAEMALFPSITPDMPFASIDKQIFDVMPFSAYLAFPLIVRSQAIGVISFFRTVQPFALDEQKVTKIVRYVDTLSSTIKNSKTYHELENSYYRIDSLLKASLELYHLKSIEEITAFTASQLVWAFPNISLSIIFNNTLNNQKITIDHNMPVKAHAFFSRHFDTLINEQTTASEDEFLSELNKMDSQNTQVNHPKNTWKLFSLHSTERMVTGKLILKGVRLKTQNKNTLTLFMHQITSAIENRLLVDSLTHCDKH